MGTKSRREYLTFELARAARKLVEEITLVKPGEEVVITADTSSDWRVVEATAEAVYANMASPSVIWYETRQPLSEEPPSPVARALEGADLWIEYAMGCIFRTEAHRRALEAGCRYVCLTGMDVDMMVRTIGKVDYAKMLELGDLLCKLAQGTKEVLVTSPRGTELRARNDGRKVFQSGKLADTKGESVMLGGQVGWLPIEETITGKLVFDGALWPPVELGVLQSPIELIVKGGVVREIKGANEALIFKRWLAGFEDPNMYRIAHYSCGFNPGVSRPTGRIVEDERVFGCIEFGLGSSRFWKAKAHTDGIVLNPSIWLDDVQIEDEGRYVHPDLVKLCIEMGVPGY